MKHRNLKIGQWLRLKGDDDNPPLEVVVTCIYPKNEHFDGVIITHDSKYEFGNIERGFNCNFFKIIKDVE